jgi:hypothetical protein
MPLPPFKLACSGCHSLQFDKRFTEEVPHDRPQIVHAFVIKKFTEYIASHPKELRESRDPDRDLTGKPVSVRLRVLTPAQWVAERTAQAEDLLWRKTCKQCHALTTGEKGSLPQKGKANPEYVGDLPYVAPPKFTEQWMPHAKFDHEAHDGFTCVSCHQKALTSTETSDILLPGIATCQTCHTPGPEHAESRCSECHTYHDWSKRREVAPKFTLPALKSAGS